MPLELVFVIFLTPLEHVYSAGRWPFSRPGLDTLDLNVLHRSKCRDGCQEFHPSKILNDVTAIQI